MKKLRITPSLLFLIIAVLIGGTIRLVQVTRLEYPINDGGMFYTMTSELRENHYRLPETSAYNGLGIPFAYPPLGFFLAGLLADLTGWSLLGIFRLLPAILSVLTIPAFYLFARELVKSESLLSLAVMVFALTPATFDWLIMGGGITRAPGFLFYLLLLFSIQRLYSRPGFRYVILTSILGAASVLSHPEAALHAVVGALVLWCFLGRNKSGMLKSLLVATLTLAITSPWWITVLREHGLSPFLAAGSTSWHDIGGILSIFKFELTNEIGLQTIGVLALVGLFLALAQKKFLLPVYLVVIFLSEPRSAPLYLSPVIAILAAMAIDEILTLLSNRVNTKDLQDGEIPIFSGSIAKLAFGILLAQWVISAFTVTLLAANTLTLNVADEHAFSWIRSHTPARSNFLLITGFEPLTDPVSEWFPALTGRVSVATTQGHEWSLARDFYEVFNQARQVQGCIYAGMGCITSWLDDTGKTVDFIYIRRLESPSTVTMEALDSALQDGLLASGQYELVYSTPEVSILQTIDR